MTEKAKKYLSDILLAIDKIEEFLKDIVSFEEYSTDYKTQSAVERQLGIIGEAVNKFSKLVPDEPLNNAKQIVGLRNRLIHTYDAIDNTIIWTIIKKYLEPLKIETINKIK